MEESPIPENFLGKSIHELRTLPRRAPCNPKRFISRSTVQRATSTPWCSSGARSCRHHRPAYWIARFAGSAPSRCHPSWPVHSVARACADGLHGVDIRTGQSAIPCKSARPRRCRDVGPQRPSRLELAVELRLGKKRWLASGFRWPGAVP